jgi:hypothetical protein
MNYLSEFERVAEQRLPTVAEVLKHHEITSIFYALRWFTLLFSQEHDIGSLLPIWDELFIHSENFMEYLIHMGVAHLEAVSRNISMNSYTQSLEAVQHGKVALVQMVRDRANESWRIARAEQSNDTDAANPRGIAKVFADIFRWFQNLT